MSHYKSYSAYKDSGIEWLGSVPAHWRILPICTLFYREKTLGHEHEELLSVYRDHGVVPKSSRDDNNNKASEDLGSYQLVEEGNLVTNKMKAWQGSIAISRYKGIVSPAYFVYKQKHQESPEYLHHLLRSLPYITGYMSASEGVRVNQWDLNPELFRRFPVLLPSLSEQKVIAGHLDREAARIDALVEKKTRFIELLREKRQVLITHAVTKGFDPNVKMKNSGVEWLGEVPEHWSVHSLSRVTISRCDGPFGSAIKSETYSEFGVRIIRLQNIGFNEFKGEDAVYIPESYKQTEIGSGHDVLPGDLLMAGLGDDRNFLGRVCVAPENIGNTIVKADCYRLRVDRKKVLPSFLAAQLSATAKIECGFISTGSTRARLNLGIAVSRRVAIPPSLAEQERITKSIEQSTLAIDRLLEKTERSIGLLKERRSALITAAVTGQIDLRERA